MSGDDLQELFSEIIEVEGFLGSPVANWYPHETATGGQWDLHVVGGPGRSTRPLRSTANALSNKVSATGVAATAGGAELVVTQR